MSLQHAKISNFLNAYQQSETIKFSLDFFVMCTYINLPFLLVNTCNFSLKIIPSDFTTCTVQVGVSSWHNIAYLLLAFLYCSSSCILREAIQMAPHRRIAMCVNSFCHDSGLRIQHQIQCKMIFDGMSQY